MEPYIEIVRNERKQGNKMPKIRAATACVSLLILSNFLIFTEKANSQVSPQNSHVSIAGVTPNEHQVVKNWVDEATHIIKSELFHKNLKSLSSSYSKVWSSQYRRYDNVNELSNILRLNDPKSPNATWMNTVVALSGSPSKDNNSKDGYSGIKTALTGWTGYSENGVSTGSMTLGRVHYDRYLNGNQIEKSCALNTMAHELSHTLSLDNKQYLQYFLDTGDSGPDLEGEAKASYLIGSVAQCTYLQKEGRISNSEILMCLKIFGVAEFRNNQCDDFIDGEPLFTP